MTSPSKRRGRIALSIAAIGGLLLTGVVVVSLAGAAQSVVSVASPPTSPGFTPQATASPIRTGSPPATSAEPSDVPGASSTPGVVPSDAPGVSPSIGGGRTFHLAPDGDDAADGTIDAPWQTITHAASRLRPGDTLLVRGGTYRGQGGDWLAAGTAARPITVAAYPGEVPVFDGEGKLGQFLWLQANSGWVTFRGLSITNYSPDESGVWLLTEGTHDVVIEDVVMTGNHGPKETDHLIYLAADKVRDITIRDSLLEGMSGACIHMYHEPNAQDVVIERNTIRDCHWGVLVWSKASRVTIRHNTFLNNDIGIDLGHANSVAVSDNLVIGNIGLLVHDPANSPGLAEDHNLWWGGSRPLRTDSRRYTVSGWATATGLGRGSITADPRLVSLDDPRPMPDSPAIGTAGDGSNIGRY